MSDELEFWKRVEDFRLAQEKLRSLTLELSTLFAQHSHGELMQAPWPERMSELHRQAVVASEDVSVALAGLSSFHVLLSDILAKFASPAMRRETRLAGKARWDAAYEELRMAEQAIIRENTASADLDDTEEARRRLARANAAFEKAAQKERDAFLECMDALRPGTRTKLDQN